MNNTAQAATLITQPYPAVGPITSPYEQQKPVKDLNKYATLKAVGKKLFTMSHNDEKISFRSSFDLIRMHIMFSINKTSIINQGFPAS